MFKMRKFGGAQLEQFLALSTPSSLYTISRNVIVAMASGSQRVPTQLGHARLSLRIGGEGAKQLSVLSRRLECDKHHHTCFDT